jgi:hypothetical protein
MRRLLRAHDRLRVGVTVALAWSTALAGHASAQAQVPCRPAPGTTTIAHSAQARIFSDDRNGNDYACLYSNGHPRYLSTTEHYEYSRVHFAGPYVAYVPIVEGTTDKVGVMNMATGRAHYYEAARPIEHAVCPEVASLVLKPDGAVAWIATNFLAEFCGPPPPGPVIEVRAHDRQGLRVLDSGTGIVPTSLRLSHSRLRWVDGGQARTATLH